jgi:hypothetical protein
MIRPNEPTSALGHGRRVNAPAAGRLQTADPAGGKDDFRLGPCVTSNAGPHGDAQLYGR